jgi:hypothetical protein
MAFYGQWDEQRLAEFDALPEKPLTWLDRIIGNLEKALASVPVKVKAPDKVKVGSCTGCNIPPEALASLKDMQVDRQHAWYLHARHAPVKRQDVNLSPLHFTCVLKVITLCQLYWKNPGELPQAFIKLVWRLAHQEGHLPVSFCDSLWSAIWKTLADTQFSEVEDCRYWFDPDGRRKGRCMKWRLKRQFCCPDAGTQKGGRHIASVSIAPPPYQPGVFRPPRVPTPYADLTGRFIEFWENVCT